MTGPDGNVLLDAALDYAARGWRVVPLHSVDVRGCSCGKDCGNSAGKHPRTKNGLNDGTADAEQIREWWGRWPRANVGVVCGPESNVWMVGPDGEQGIADFERLQAEHGEIVRPLGVSRSQGGGRHLLFTWPADGRPIKNRKNHRGTKIDVRASGDTGAGLFVAPPSAGPKGQYEWLIGPEVGDHPASAWVVEWARADEVKERQPDPPVRVPTPVPQDRKAVFQRAVDYLNKIPGAIEGQKGSDPTFWAARVLVWGFSLPEHTAQGLLSEFYNPRCEPAWSPKELQHKVKQAATVPFDKPKGWLLQSAEPWVDHPPPPPPTPPPAVKPWEVRPGGAGPRAGLTASDLFTREFPPPRFTVADFLPEGLTVLAGKSKGGKSFLALQLGWAVAAGQPLSGRKVERGDVLYLALEDPARRMANRLHQLRPSVGYDPTPNFHIQPVGSWPRADQGGLYHIAEWLEARKGTARLVMIDTFAKFRTPGKANGNSYSEDYEAVGGLAELLAQYAVSGIVIHHTRKVKAEDPFDEISGTVAMSGAADTMMVLERERGSAEGRLFITGRDIAEGTVPIRADAARHWTLGDRIDGIDTTGRMSGEATKSGNKIEECVSWLLKFLDPFAHPSNEIEAAAKKAEFSFPTLKAAKAQIGRRKGGPLWAHQIGGEWWNGLGHYDHWTLRPGAELQGERVSRPPRRDTGEGAEPDDEF